MSTLPKSRVGSKNGARHRKDDHRNKTPVERRTDQREQLYNDGECGPIERVQLPEAMITSLLGIGAPCFD